MRELYRITVLTDSLLRLEWNSEGTFEERKTQNVVNREFPEVEKKIWREDGMFYLETNQLFLSYRENESFSADNLSIQLKESGKCWRYGEPISNLGGTASTLDGSSGSIPLENGVCSMDGIAVIDDSDSLAFDEDGWLVPRMEGTDIYVFAYGHRYLEAVQDFHRLTGAPPMLPAFAFGNWWSRWYPYSEESYKELVGHFETEDIPFSVAVIDMDWHITELPHKEPGNYEGWTGYTWNEKLFPDYKRFLTWLHEKNYHVTLNLHPAGGVRSHEKMYAQMATRLGIDADSGETVYFNIADKEFMKAYFEVIHHPYEEGGVDFWWIDWQQGKDMKAVNPNYKESYMDQITPLWMLNHYHMMDAARKEKRSMIFSRYCGKGAHRYPIGFSGDTIINWNSLKFQPYFTATASNIGYGWWSHDIGGFGSGYRDDELQVRWVQFGVFSPITRLHSCKPLFAGKEPWNYSLRAEKIIDDFLRLRHRLFPYLYTMNRRANEELIPLIQPMYYSYPEQREAYEMRNEYWFGSECIVNPITEKSNDMSDLGHAQVWLPEGQWVDFFRGDVYEGGKTWEIYRSLEEIPVFCKAGAIIPCELSEIGDNSLGNKTDMEVLVFSGADNQFTIYEDGGEDLTYQQGAFVTTELQLKWQNDKAVFTIEGAKGDEALIPQKRNWTISFRGFNEPKDISVMVDSIEQEYQCTYDSSNATCLVKVGNVPCSAKVEICLDGSRLIYDNSRVEERAYRILMRAQLNEDYKTNLWEVFHWEKPLQEKIDKFKWYVHSQDLCYITEALIELLELAGR